MQASLLRPPLALRLAQVEGHLVSAIGRWGLGDGVSLYLCEGHKGLPASVASLGVHGGHPAG